MPGATVSGMTDTPVHQAMPVGGRGPHVVVGVDGSPDSIAALRAGERAAEARGGTLVAVSAWSVPTVVLQAPSVFPDLEDAAVAVLHHAIEAAFHGRCSVPIDTVVQLGGAAPILLEQSRDAILLVVGSRGHGGFTGLLLGSVSMACAMHAACPVLVLHDGPVHAPGAPRRARRVVVGVGGSADASRVLRVAAVAAATMDAELVAVAAWEGATMFPDAIGDFRAEFVAHAQRDLDQEIERAFADGRPPRLTRALRQGQAASVLLQESARADLVVVGRSGHSALAGMVLGSVALPVAEHAKSPVLIVPAEAPRRRKPLPDGLRFVEA